MKKTIFTLGTLLLLFAACKKDKDDPSEVTVENLSGSYKITKITVLSNNTETEVTDFLLDACEKDDIIKLNTDRTLQVEDKGTLCSPPNNYTGTWSLPTKTTIEIQGSQGTQGQQGTIRKFDGTNLEVSIPYQTTSLITYYTKQ